MRNNNYIFVYHCNNNVLTWCSNSLERIRLLAPIAYRFRLWSQSISYQYYVVYDSTFIMNPWYQILWNPSLRGLCSLAHPPPHSPVFQQGHAFRSLGEKQVGTEWWRRRGTYLVIHWTKSNAQKRVELGRRENCSSLATQSSLQFFSSFFSKSNSSWRKMGGGPKKR